MMQVIETNQYVLKKTGQPVDVDYNEENPTLNLEQIIRKSFLNQRRREIGTPHPQSASWDLVFLDADECKFRDSEVYINCKLKAKMPEVMEAFDRSNLLWLSTEKLISSKSRNDWIAMMNQSEWFGPFRGRVYSNTLVFHTSGKDGNFEGICVVVDFIKKKIYARQVDADGNICGFNQMF